uniref:Uncharacterized protein n=1 Tax=Schistosoma japonicum TaxID=6182 RepID=Q5C4Z8_SCHJA|nr:unknown [Schistosoma japonicum]
MATSPYSFPSSPSLSLTSSFSPSLSRFSSFSPQPASSTFILSSLISSNLLTHTSLPIKLSLFITVTSASASASSSSLSL